MGERCSSESRASDSAQRAWASDVAVPPAAAGLLAVGPI